MMIAMSLNADTGSISWKSEEVEHIISSVVDETLKDEAYTDEAVGKWNDRICEGIMAQLINLKWSARFSVDCLIMQRNGAGLHSATASFLDNSVDGQYTYLWPKEKSRDHPNKSILCLVTVFGAIM